MIPKILNFIWFGNNIPKYAFYSMYKFHEMNPDFRINFIHKTINQVENLDDDILKNSYEIYQDSITNDKYKDSDLFYVKKYNLFFQKCLTSLMALLDIYRREYVQKFGGIYLDCDTFPVKPFDENLLNCKKFMVFDINTDYFDNYFFGSQQNEICNDDRFDNKEDTNKTKKIYHNKKILTWDIIDKFTNCNLENYKCDDKNAYILHMCKYTWDPKNCKVPKIKFDI